MAIAISWAVYVFVAATACSLPALVSITNFAAIASGECGSLVMASVGAPWRLPSLITLTISGDCPDCEIPTTRAFFRAGGRL